MGRCLLPALLALVLAAGCGDDAMDESTEPTAEPAVETTERTTTTTEETLPPSTTTTTEYVPPWALVEFPDWPEPILAEEFGGPLALGTLCVGLDLTNFDEDSRAPAELRSLLAALGIETADEGCDATLAVTAVASRTSARYRESGTGATRTCWGGERATGTVALSLGGEAIAEWPIDVDEPPPDELRGCPGEDSTVVSWHWTGTTLVALIDMLGPAPAVANDLQLHWDDAARERYRALRESAGFADVLAAGLAHPSPDVAEAASRKVMNWATDLEDEPPPYPEALWGTIPYLIAGPHLDEGCCSSAALQQIFFRSRQRDDVPDGFDTRSRADWWALWEADPTPPGG